MIILLQRKREAEGGGAEARCSGHPRCSDKKGATERGLLDKKRQTRKQAGFEDYRQQGLDYDGLIRRGVVHKATQEGRWPHSRRKI